ncbi:hypothetical protein ACJMK2_010497 [Sinanodonta woodiana]|uniref:CW-type domain-containing protein n=1 Tax=Sinanodonta woodiana TaxID=1069815 RepID=A0ABD3VFK0_SINWO
MKLMNFIQGRNKLLTENINGERDKNGWVDKNIDLVMHNDDPVLVHHRAAPSDQTDIVLRNGTNAELQRRNIVQSRSVTGDDVNMTLINKSFPAWIKAPLMLNQVSSDSRSITDITYCNDDHMVPTKDHVKYWFETRQAMEDISSNSVFNSMSVQCHNNMIRNSSEVHQGNGTFTKHVDGNDKIPTRVEVEDTMFQSQICQAIDQGIGQRFVGDSCIAKTKDIYNSNEQTLVWSGRASMLHEMAGPTQNNGLYNSVGSVYKQLPSQQFINTTATDSYEDEIFDGKEIPWPSFGDNEVNSEVETMSNNRQIYTMAAHPVQPYDLGKGFTSTYMPVHTYFDKTFCEKKQNEKIHLSLESIQVRPTDNISDDTKPRQLTSKCEHRVQMGTFAESSLGAQAYPNVGTSWFRTPLQHDAYPHISTNPTSACFLYHPLIYPDCRNHEGRRDISCSQFDRKNQESKMPYSSHVQQNPKVKIIDTYDKISSAKDRLSFHEQNGLCEEDDELTTMEHSTIHREALLTNSDAGYQRQQQTVSMIQRDAPLDIGSMTTETSTFAGQVDPLTSAYAISMPYFMDQTFTSAESKANQDQKSSVFSSSEYILDGVQLKESRLGDSGYFGVQASVPRLNSFGQDNQLYRHEEMAPINRWQHNDNPISPKRTCEDSYRTFSWMDPQVSVENFRPVNPNLIHNSCISTVSGRYDQMQKQMTFPNFEECPYDNRLRRPKNGFIRFANEKRKELAKKLSFYEELKKIRDEQPEWKWRSASEPKIMNQIMTTRLRPRNKLKVQHSLNAIIGLSAQSSKTKHDKSEEPLFGNKDCWVQCDLCLKWRQLPEGVILENEIPTFWFCYMNPDTSKSACYVEEELPAPNSN